MIAGKYRTLVLATLTFHLGFVVWFSFAPYTGEIAAAFDLSVAHLGFVASAAVVAVPLGRIVVGPLTDRYGAPVTAGWTMLLVGTISIVSAFARTYEVFLASRILASLAGVTFVIGAQHVSEWFDEANLGLAEGIYAGVGNAGAGLGAYYALPRIFGEGYDGLLFASNWRAAFFYTGVLAVLVGVTYYAFGDAAKSDAKRRATKQEVTARQWLFVATRYGAVALSAAYVMTFGLELAMNGWLGTYYREGFGQGDLVRAATLAATFSIAAGLLRPIGGYVSDQFARRELDLLSAFEGRHREQWTLLTLAFVVFAMVAMTVAGLAGDVRVAAATAILVGLGCAFSEGAVFAQVPSMFPDDTGTVAGVVGGLGTIGGVVYPLVFAAPFLPNLHVGYAIVGLTMAPIVLLSAWVFRPDAAQSARMGGVLVDVPSDQRTGITSDD